MSEHSLLKYVDAEDKCFGVAGMALAVFIFNVDEKLAGISLDRQDLDSIEFLPQYMFPESSSLSPKVVWKHLIERFHLASALMISNIMCRTVAGHHTAVSPSQRREMLEYLTERGERDCDLGNDEVEMIFRKNYDILHQTYSSLSVVRAAVRLAGELAKRRSLSRSDLLDLLSTEAHS